MIFMIRQSPFQKFPSPSFPFYHTPFPALVGIPDTRIRTRKRRGCDITAPLYKKEEPVLSRFAKQANHTTCIN